MALDSDDDKDDGDDNDDNEVNSKVVEIGTREALAMFDRLVNLKDLTKEERNSLVAMKDKLEIITIQNRKQSRMTFLCVRTKDCIIFLLVDISLKHFKL